MNERIPVTKTGLVSSLAHYAARGDLWLTEQIVGADADRVRERMKRRSGWVTEHFVFNGTDEKIDPPVYFEPLQTDEVWAYTTTFERLSGQAGYALVREGVVVCDVLTRIA